MTPSGDTTTVTHWTGHTHTSCSGHGRFLYRVTKIFFFFFFKGKLVSHWKIKPFLNDLLIKSMFMALTDSN